MLYRDIKDIPSEWTMVKDCHAGSGDLKFKVGYEYVFINKAREQATKIFEYYFSVSPYKVSCACCGNDFNVTDSDKEVLRLSTFCPGIRGLLGKEYTYRNFWTGAKQSAGKYAIILWQNKDGDIHVIA